MSISAPYEVTVVSSMKAPENIRRDAPTPLPETQLTDLAPQTSVPVSQPNDPLKMSISPSPLIQDTEIKKSRHTRQNSSVSSAEGDTHPSSETQGDEPMKRSRSRSASTPRRPVGVSPEQAARSMPMSVKSALSLHAHTESMGYMVLMPHEVVQLNDVTCALPDVALIEGTPGARKENRFPQEGGGGSPTHLRRPPRKDPR
jgi:hypothetical protein